MGMSCSQKPAASAENDKQSQRQIDLLVGTYTGSGSEGIYLLSFEPANGALSEKRLAAEIKNPSYLTISPDNKYVYSVGETDSGVVAAFSWAEGVDTLTAINKVSAEGVAPCYIDFSQKQNLVAVANYVSGNVGFTL